MADFNEVFLVTCPEVGELDTESIYLAKELQKRGINASIVNWNDTKIQWDKADLAISRTTSSYILNPPKFIEWAKRVEKTTTLWNSSKVIEWNHHKRYLLELQDNGISMPPTILIPYKTDQTMEQI